MIIKETTARGSLCMLFSLLAYKIRIIKLKKKKKVSPRLQKVEEFGFHF